MCGLRWGKVGHRRERHNLVRREFFLVVFQGRNGDLSFPGIGAMNGLAVMAEGHLREPFGVATCLGPLGPGIAIAVERHAGNFQPLASLFEFRGTVGFADGAQVREQRASARKLREDGFQKVMAGLTTVDEIIRVTESAS